MQFETFNNKNTVTLLNVFYVAQMKQNLLSYSKITQRNKIFSFGNISKIYNRNNVLVAVAKKMGNLYHMSI